MDMPVSMIAAKPSRKGRKRRAGSGSAPPLPGAPMLVAAEYLASTWVRLTFDRAVSAPAAVAGESVRVEDGPGTETVWAGGAVTALGPVPGEVLEVALEAVAATGWPVTRLTATAGTGIVSAFDGTPWAGVTDLALPFP